MEAQLTLDGRVNWHACRQVSGISVADRRGNYSRPQAGKGPWCALTANEMPGCPSIYHLAQGTRTPVNHVPGHCKVRSFAGPALAGIPIGRRSALTARSPFGVSSVAPQRNGAKLGAAACSTCTDPRSPVWEAGIFLCPDFLPSAPVDLGEPRRSSGDPAVTA